MGRARFDMKPNETVPKNPRWPLHFAALAVVAIGVGLVFLQPTRLGDDFTYWSFAFDLHERGLRAWQVHSFHDLRWPVWGVCWLLQSIVGPGLVSFYGAPLLYLAAGAALAFACGRMVAGSLRVAWMAGIAFLFHPLLDTVCYRPMPDLSEAVWGAAAVLAWWRLVRAETRGRSLLWAVLTGACIFIGESNRVTGAFIVPVLLICTLIYARRRFGWLVLAGAVAGAFYAAEAAFYHQLFGDWLHNIHANLGNKSAPGTHAIPVWSLPFRFLDTLWNGNRLAPFYCALTAAGLWSWWKSREARLPADQAHMPLGIPVVWFGALYLEYACAPQSLWPWRPLVRDADRFLCGLVVPMSVLVSVGIAAMRWPEWRAVKVAARHPIFTAVVSVALLAAVTSRAFFDLNFVLPMHRHLAALPSGTKVFTHDSMRALAFMVDPNSARRFAWSAPEKILHRTPELEARAAASEQFWYIRDLAWLNTRKALEKKSAVAALPLASYFRTPDRDWRMNQLLVRGDTPDLVFYRRRTPADPPPRRLEATAPEFAGLVPPLPFAWTRTGTSFASVRWSVPPSLRGQFVRLEIEAAAAKVEAVSVGLTFLAGKKERAVLLLKPYLQPEPGTDFFAFQIPPDADACEVEFRISKDAKSVRFTGFRAVVEPPPGAL